MTHLKRFIALALCLALVFALSACGGDTPAAEESENPTGLVWTADYADLDVDLQYIQSAAYANGKLYLTGNSYNEETYESRNLFLAADPATGEMAELTGYAPPAAPEGAEYSDFTKSVFNIYSDSIHLMEYPKGIARNQVSYVYRYEKIKPIGTTSINTVYSDLRTKTGEEIMSGIKQNLINLNLNNWITRYHLDRTDD